MNKYFVDSSIAQLMLLGTNAYKRYLNNEFADGNVYISKYVEMEIRRSCIVPMIQFYFVLDMPSIEGIDDALALWRNRFSNREIKAVVGLVSQMISAHDLRGHTPSDKAKALRRIGSLIKRIDADLRQKFTNIGVNTTRCTRAQISIVTSRIDDQSLTEQLREFITKFDNVTHCRSHCQIDDFLLNRFRSEIEEAIKLAELLPNPRSKNTRGFVQISDNLKKIVVEGEKACSCRMCGNIGDAVITLETPRDMRLEHTDYAFDQLCTIVSQAHYRHISENEFHKRASQSSSSSSNENV